MCDTETSSLILRRVSQRDRHSCKNSDQERGQERKETHGKVESLLQLVELDGNVSKDADQDEERGVVVKQIKEDDDLTHSREHNRSHGCRHHRFLLAPVLNVCERETM